MVDLRGDPHQHDSEKGYNETAGSSLQNHAQMLHTWAGYVEMKAIRVPNQNHIFLLKHPT